MASWRAGRPEAPWSAFALIVIVAAIALDQATKAWASAALEDGQVIDVLPILALLRVGNTGIAFSTFSGGGLPLTLVTIGITGAVIAFWLTSRDGGRLAALGYALILGGALGNVVDRVRLGYVIDFLWLHFGETTLFVFNLADAALTLGPILLVAAYLWPAPAPSAE